MDKYSQMRSVYTTVWFAASGLNGVISTCIILYGQPQWNNNLLLAFFLTFGCSLIFALPVLLVAMLISSFLLSVKAATNVFELVLLVTFFVSLATAILFNGLFKFINDHSVYLSASVVVSAVTAVMIFRNKLKAINDIQD